MTLSQRIAEHLRGNVVGYIAVFIALSGTAMALPGKKSVKSDDIAPSAVKAKAIKAGAVKNSKLATGAVTSSKIGDGSIVGADLANSAITSAQLADDSVVRQKILAGTINGGKLANGSVDSQKVNDGSLLAEDFAAGQLSDGFVTEAPPAGFVLSRGGRLFLTATFVPTCASSCNYSLTVDGNPVQGTGMTSTATTPTQLTLTGVTAALAAGSRTVAIQTSAGSIDEPTIAGILLQ